MTVVEVRYAKLVGTDSCSEHQNQHLTHARLMTTRKRSGLDLRKPAAKMPALKPAR